MRMNWRVFFGLLMVGSVASGATMTSKGPLKWQTDYQSAMDQAGREDRVVMLYFTGSDWCSWCTRLKKEVLEHVAFEAYADSYLVPVKVDFPRRKPLPASQQQYNDALASRFQVRSFPTLVFIDANGREVLRRGYEDGGGAAFVESMHKKLGMAATVTIKRRMEKLHNEPVRPRSLDRRPARDFPPEPPPPLFGGAAAAPPVRYTNLVLKSISGPAGRRLALLNNQTLGVGESASVKFEDRSLRVRCDEIRERSVVVKVEGETAPREVRLVGSE